MEYPAYKFVTEIPHTDNEFWKKMEIVRSRLEGFIGNLGPFTNWTLGQVDSLIEVSIQAGMNFDRKYKLTWEE